MKRLIVGTDGTWNSKDRAKADGSGLTNVAKLLDALAEKDQAGIVQRPKYHKGVGTGPWWDKLVGGAFGVGIGEIIRDCYEWIVDNYAPGDELYFFGFSRGAYTARSIVGFIRNCGILLPEKRGMVGRAYNFYRDRSPQSHPNSPDAVKFRADNSHPGLPILRCIGVWDTVGSLGVPISGPLGWYSRRAFGFHDVQLSSWVQNAFHAIAVDERRKPFAPTLWKVKDADATKADFKQRVEQAWFPGVHSNVGGGYADEGLSDLALAWMIDRAASCGLQFKPDAVARIEGDAMGKLYDSMTWFYRAMGQFLRPIKFKEIERETQKPYWTYEDVHQTAFDRRKRYQPPDYRPTYDPENLRNQQG